jgi:hypothetical protein
MSQVIGSGEDAVLVAGGPGLVGGEGWFYLLSVAHSRREDGVLTWWAPNSTGYVFRLERAGRYSEEQIAKHPDHYDRGDGARAVPCSLVDSMAIRVADSSGRGVDPAEGPDDLVVDFQHLRKLSKPHRGGTR